MLSTKCVRKSYICYIPRYTDVWNRHSESEIHDIHEIGSGTKLLFPFLSLKVFRHEERETQSFYADYFYIVSSQTNQRTVPVAHKVVWLRPGLNVDSLVRRQELNSLLFLKTQPTLLVRDVTHISYLRFLFWHLWMTYPLRACVNTSVNVASNSPMR